MKIRGWLATLGGAFLMVAPLFGAGVAQAQTLNITGCATFTYNSGSGTGSISITCSPAVTTPGAPSCQSLIVSPANDSTAPASITLTANCTAGTNLITSYSFTGGGLIGTQASNSVTISPVPTASTSFSVTASDGSLTSNSVGGRYDVGSTSPAPGTVDLSACTAAGFTGVPMDVEYPSSTTGSLRTVTSGFSGSNAIVVRFTVPMVTTDTSSFSLAQNGTSMQINRLATLATQPCQFATKAAPVGSIIASSLGVSPTINMGVSVPTSTSPYTGLVTPALLTAGQTYYLTIVNRNGYFGASNFSNSCTSLGRCDMNINFLN